MKFLLLSFIFCGSLFAQYSLEKLEDISEVVHFEGGKKNKARLLEAVDESLIFLNRPSAKFHYPINGFSINKIKESCLRFKEIISMDLSDDEINRLIKNEFDIYEVKEMLYTGYFEPIYRGSKKPNKEYRYPLYQMPKDLILNKKGKILGRKTSSGKLVPYWTRKQIESDGKLKGKGLEIAYLKDPYEVYMIHLQGSGVIDLIDGQPIRVGYKARNCSTVGFSLPKELKKDKKMDVKDLTPSKIWAYFQDKPKELLSYLNRNPSYVFFVEREKGPLGSMSVKLTPGYSLSLDQTVYPKGALCFIDFNLYLGKQNGKATYQKRSQFAFNQDTGGAINGPRRCELFCGTGEEAYKEAGDIFVKGSLYLLILKSFD